MKKANILPLTKLSLLSFIISINCLAQSPEIAIDHEVIAGAIAKPATNTTNDANYLSFATNDERNTTEIFKKASPVVAFVTNNALYKNPFTLKVTEVPQSVGSAFVWSKDGLLVTSFHLIVNADKLTVTLQGMGKFDAQIVGIAPERDIAVLRLINPPADLKTLPLGDSSQLSVGRKVLAIGNPFGLETTLTVGIVSALDREIQSPSDRRIHGVIQTDATINPGSSGGPLLNSLGQIIGVNTAIYSPNGANTGIGFAIPVNTVKKVVPQLIAYGKLLHPILGVELANDQWARHNGINGVAIIRVLRGLPAAEAGMLGVQLDAQGNTHLGDVITKIEGKPIFTQDDYLSAIEKHKTGDVIIITTLRGNREIHFEITLSESR